MTDVQSLQALVEAHPRITMENARARLYEQHPVWLLRMDGVLVAANLMALWLWGGIRPDRRPDAAGFLGANVFDILTRNLFRIPVVKNRSFFLRKSQIDKKIAQVFSNAPMSSFAAAMASDPELQCIYETADPNELSDVWHYVLEIRHPAGDRPADFFLDVQTTVSAIYQDDTPVGYLAVYQSRSGLTRTVFVHEFGRLFDPSGRRPYVLCLETESQVEEPDSGAGGGTARAEHGVRVVSLQDLNRSFQQADDLLDEQLKVKHPVTPIEEIKRQYPGQWVAITTVRVDETGDVIDARIFANADSKWLLYERMRAIKAEHPSLRLTSYFAGHCDTEGRLIA